MVAIKKSGWFYQAMSEIARLGEGLSVFMARLSAIITTLGAVTIMYGTVQLAKNLAINTFKYAPNSDFVVYLQVVGGAVGVGLSILLFWFSVKLAFLIKQTTQAIGGHGESGIFILFLAFVGVAFLANSIIVGGANFGNVEQVVMYGGSLIAFLLFADIFFKNGVGALGVMGVMVVALVYLNMYTGAYLDGERSKGVTAEFHDIVNERDATISTLNSQISRQKDRVKRQEERQKNGLGNSYSKEQDRLVALETQLVQRMNGLEKQKEDAKNNNAYKITVFVVILEAFVFLVHIIVAFARQYGGIQAPRQEPQKIKKMEAVSTDTPKVQKGEFSSPILTKKPPIEDDLDSLYDAILKHSKTHFKNGGTNSGYHSDGVQYIAKATNGFLAKAMMMDIREVAKVFDRIKNDGRYNIVTVGKSELFMDAPVAFI